MTVKIVVHQELLPLGVTSEDVAAAITVENFAEVEVEKLQKAFVRLVNLIARGAGADSPEYYEACVEAASCGIDVVEL